jgi:predicted tellurium resistance membrane protein TerC
MFKQINHKLSQFRDKLNKPIKVIITLIAIELIVNPANRTYPPVNQSLLVIVPVIVIVWIWRGSSKDKKGNEQ